MRMKANHEGIKLDDGDYLIMVPQRILASLHGHVHFPRVCSVSFAWICQDNPQKATWSLMFFAASYG